MEVNNPDNLVHQMLANGGDYDDLLHRPLLEVTRLIADGLPVSDSLRQQVLDDVLELWKNPPFYRMQEIINQIFCETTDPKFAEELAERLIVLAQERWWQGNEIAPIVAKVGKKKEAMSILMAAIHREIQDCGDVEDKIYAALMLSDLGEKEAAIPVLFNMAIGRFDSSERSKAARSLGKIGKQNQEVINGLLTLVNDEVMESSVRIATAHALLDLEEPQLDLSVLHAIARNEKEEDRDRQRAAALLGKAGERELAVSLLLELTHDERAHAVVVCHAAQDLVNLGERQAGIDILINAIGVGEPCVICGSVTCGGGRQFVIDKLIALGEQDIAVSILLPLLNNQDLTASSRLSIAAALAKLGKSKEATLVLLDLMHDKDFYHYTRCGAIEALGKWGERREEVVEALLTTARGVTAEKSERTKAIKALGDFGVRSLVVLETLAEIARFKFDRSLACEALWKLTETESESLIASR